jgi:predicted 3-demethylubiquinone-9 3-methyltransferase (glyoxalase superfamily)
MNCRNQPAYCRFPQLSFTYGTYVCQQTNINYMQKITPVLWFDGNLEESVNFYVSVFKNSKVTSGLPAQGGKAMSATFELDGQKFIGLNGGPMFKFTEAVSFYVSCETQEEIDEMWEKLSEGGQKSRCGWLKDKFGLSWQVVPPILGQLLADKDPAKSKRVMDAMLKMDKIDIAALRAAAGG